MTSKRLHQLIACFASARIAVVGDFFLDKYLDTEPAIAEPSVETGKTARQVVSVRRSPGAAGTAVSNLAKLGAGTLHAIGATGNDGEAYDLRQELGFRRCDTSRLLPFESLITPCYLKPRDSSIAGLAGEYIRYDTRNRTPTPPEIIDHIVESIDDLLPDVDAIIIADQVNADDCGVMTRDLRNVLAARSREHENVIFWVDSRRHIRDFRNMIIKPNQFEAVGNLNPGPNDEIPLEDLKKVVPQLRDEVCSPVFLTRGHQGALISEPNLTVVPGVRLQGETDPTGAGDSFTAGAVLTLVAGGSLWEAALVGNLVASITVQQLATTGTASADQLIERLSLWQTQNLPAATDPPA
jgi:bifunctional ADP-heptose synthase (sugar kinase/adenylyltransferase)